MIFLSMINLFSYDFVLCLCQIEALCFQVVHLSEVQSLCCIVYIICKIRRTDEILKWIQIGSRSYVCFFMSILPLFSLFFISDFLRWTILFHTWSHTVLFTCVCLSSHVQFQGITCWKAPSFPYPHNHMSFSPLWERSVEMWFTNQSVIIYPQGIFVQAYVLSVTWSRWSYWV